jgi:Kef-type K+ transport system membrane component KefB
MITNTLAILSLVLVLMLVVPIVCRKIRIPSIVGFILVGMAIGPLGFNILPHSETIETLGKLGILYILFQAGIELDRNDFRQERKRAGVFGLMSFLFPALLGAAAGVLLGYGWQTVVLLGAMLGSHTLMTYPIVSRYGLQRLPAVGIVVGGTLLTTALSLAMLSVVSLETTWYRWLMKIALFLFLTIWLFPYLLRECFKRWTDPTLHFLLVMVVLVLSSWLADFADLEGILGAFICGVALNGLVPQRSTLMARINFMGNTLFVPLFLLSVGMLLDVRAFFDGGWGLIVALAIIVAKLLGKWFASFAAQKAFHLSADERRLIFGLTHASSAGTLAIVTVGLQRGIFDIHIFNGAIIMILAMCTIASFLTEAAAKRLALDTANGPTTERDIEPWRLISVGSDQRSALQQLSQLSELHEVEIDNRASWQEAHNSISHDGRATLVYREQQPLNTIRRIIVGVPPNAEKEVDFISCFGQLRRLSGQIGASVMFFCTPDSKQALEAFCRRRGKALRASYRTVNEWSKMSEALQSELRRNDLVALMSARTNTTSYNPLFAGNYDMLQRDFAGYSHLILYPCQDISAGSSEIFFSFG